MTIQLIPLEQITANPWQTRQGEPDPEYIKALALDIAANGLLQTPVGRKLDDQIQLSFGHNRLAAFKFLADTQGKKHSTWSEMPVDLRPLTDEQMADYAWSENERRLDLNALERALAIQKRIADFGWSHKQVGEHMGLSRPVISNALRLLELPAEMQAKLASGAISERQAMALLPLFALPESLRKKGEKGWNDQTKPSQIVEDAVRGESSDALRNRIEILAKRFSLDLDVGWPLDETPECFAVERDGLRANVCAECPALISQKDGKRCADPACFEVRKRLWQAYRLKLASDVSGIKALGDDEPYNGTKMVLYSNRDYAPAIRSAGCENLRLKYDASPYNAQYKGEATLAAEGFPEAALYCVKREGQCKCLAGLKVASTLAKQAEYERSLPGDEGRGDGLPAAREEIGAPEEEAPIQSAAELRELAKQAEALKRQERKQIELLKATAGEVYAQGLASDNPAVWRKLLEKVDYSTGSKADADLSVLDLRVQIGYKLAEQDAYFYGDPNVKKVLSKLNNALISCGLPHLRIKDETVETVEPSAEEGGDLQVRFERVLGWIDGLRSQAPSVEALAGNIQNLRKILIDMDGGAPEALSDDEEGVFAWISRLDDLRAVLESPEWATDGWYNLNYILDADLAQMDIHTRHVPAHLLAYALALVSGRTGQGKRAAAIRARLAVIEKEREVA